MRPLGIGVVVSESRFEAPSCASGSQELFVREGASQFEMTDFQPCAESTRAFEGKRGRPFPKGGLVRLGVFFEERP